MLCASVCLVVTSRGLAVKLQTPRHASGDMSGKTSDLYVVGMLGPPACFPGGDDRVEGRQRFVERCIGVVEMELVDVDVVGAQPVK